MSVTVKQENIYTLTFDGLEIEGFYLVDSWHGMYLFHKSNGHKPIFEVIVTRLTNLTSDMLEVFLSFGKDINKEVKEYEAVNMNNALIDYIKKNKKEGIKDEN